MMWFCYQRVKVSCRECHLGLNEVMKFRPCTNGGKTKDTVFQRGAILVDYNISLNGKKMDQVNNCVFRKYV